MNCLLFLACALACSCSLSLYCPPPISCRFPLSFCSSLCLPVLKPGINGTLPLFQALYHRLRSCGVEFTFLCLSLGRNFLNIGRRLSRLLSLHSFITLLQPSLLTLYLALRYKDQNSFKSLEERPNSTLLPFLIDRH